MHFPGNAFSSDNRRHQITLDILALIHEIPAHGNRILKQKADGP
jgi:hypothetical protein